MAPRPKRPILASASASRAALLRAAGIEFTIEPANIDEAKSKRKARALGGSALLCAAGLAVEKATAISERFPDALVIGADQMLMIGDEWFDKPTSLAEARNQLLALRGRTHVLATAACVAQNGEPVWQATSEPELTMREFSEAFLDGYIAAEAESLLGSVGAYRVEGLGVQLFARINGDHFAVLGLPLIELLGFLRERGVVAA